MVTGGLYYLWDILSIVNSANENGFKATQSGDLSPYYTMGLACVLVRFVSKNVRKTREKREKNARKTREKREKNARKTREKCNWLAFLLNV